MKKQKIIFLFFFFLIGFIAQSQEKSIRGIVLDKQTRDKLTGVSIYCCDSLFSTSTKKGGKYFIKVPDSAKTLNFSLQGYQQEKLDIHKRFYPRFIDIELKNNQESDYSKKLKKNVIAFAPTELINRKFSIQYERFINQRNSAGIYTDLYLNSKQLFFDDPVCNGLKMQLFYRFYPWRNMHNAGFFHGKLMGGYFNVDDIYYHEDNQAYYGTFLSEQFYTFGAGAAWGWSWYHWNKMVLSLSLGFQIFPYNVPKTYQEGNTNYTLQGASFILFNIQPWYWGGPGSIFEIKFMLGGIF